VSSENKVNEKALIEMQTIPVHHSGGPQFRRSARLNRNRNPNPTLTRP